MRLDLAVIAVLATLTAIMVLVVALQTTRREWAALGAILIGATLLYALVVLLFSL